MQQWAEDEFSSGSAILERDEYLKSDKRCGCPSTGRNDKLRFSQQ
jgi:hypothetical protein